MLIGLLIIISSWRLLMETVAVLMEHSPAHIAVDKVRDAIVGSAGVTGAHDLNVWTIANGLESLSVHVTVQEDLPAVDILQRIRHVLSKRFGIDHETLQFELEHLPEGWVEV